MSLKFLSPYFFFVIYEENGSPIINIQTKGTQLQRTNSSMFLSQHIYFHKSCLLSFTTHIFIPNSTINIILLIKLFHNLLYMFISSYHRKNPTVFHLCRSSLLDLLLLHNTWEKNFYFLSHIFARKWSNAPNAEIKIIFN